ncbi:MAG: isochorismatase family protein [Pseudomonadota bacterium]|nr:isochorismatase family protein [Pseudomonadota bacterium]
MAIPRIATYPMPATVPESRVQWPFEPSRAALLVHDMQDYFLDFYDSVAAPVPQLLSHLRQLIDMARARGMPVFYTAQPTRQEPCARGLLTDMWGPGLTARPERSGICAELAPLPQDVVLDKWRYSAFQRSSLRERLQALERDQLVIGGVYAHIGCLMTACDAFMHDIKPFVVADALADFSTREHAMALEYVASRCGRVVSTAELLQAAAAGGCASVVPASLADLKALVARELRIDLRELNDDDNLVNWGLDSIRIMAWVERWRVQRPAIEFVHLAAEPTLTAWWRLLRDASAPATA